MIAQTTKGKVKIVNLVDKVTLVKMNLDIDG